ncbi:Uncharacterised protein [Mycobacteroides abscessus subsp. abscessus]|nr:Uncharacterised protein [Mycobacteroides abscessus subsp. abscessus]
MVSRPVTGSTSFQNGLSTRTNVLDDCMYRVRSSAVHIFCENNDSSQSISVVNNQDWQVANTAG